MIRTGIGFDVHKFEQADDAFVYLGGIKVPSKYKVIAHSDGDVLLHALTDAILGAIAADDIGVHFPPTDIKWKDANSTQFVKHAVKLMKEKGGSINNVDAIILAERPKVMPYKEEIRKNIAEMLEINIDQVNLKATTTEKLGFVGREEGLAAQVICTISI
jgi:2-C-methyl-D-erythritol 4-phosphate cytidylyltransferase/2-C-methyl-D-erythritol 2,4-cyclodiphosphate synthase